MNDSKQQFYLHIRAAPDGGGFLVAPHGDPGGNPRYHAINLLEAWNSAVYMSRTETGCHGITAPEDIKKRLKMLGVKGL